MSPKSKKLVLILMILMPAFLASFLVFQLHPEWKYFFMDDLIQSYAIFLVFYLLYQTIYWLRVAIYWNMLLSLIFYSIYFLVDFTTAPFTQLISLKIILFICCLLIVNTIYKGRKISLKDLLHQNNRLG